MNSMKIWNLFLLLAASLLVSCLQEDPQLQALRDERDAAFARIQKLEEEAQSAKSSPRSEDAALQKEVESLKEQLEIARAEAKKASERTPEALSEEELLVLLRNATEEHRRAIRERFDVVNIVLSEFSMPEKMAHPYRCGVQYDLVEKSTGEPYHLDVSVSAPPSGIWEVPPVSEFATKIKKGPRVAVASTNPPSNSASGAGITTLNPNGQTVGGLTGTGAQPSSPGGQGANQSAIGRGQPVNGLPGGGGGQFVTGVPDGGGPNITSGQNFQQPQNVPSQPAPEPSGPGLGNISKKLKVDW